MRQRMLDKDSVHFAFSLHHLGKKLLKKGDLNSAEFQYRAGLKCTAASM